MLCSCMSAFKKTAGSFSFKYDISLPKICCMWGGPMDDQKKNFSGLVGDLLNGYSDIGWANLFFNLDQAQVMDYTDAYAVDYLAWMVKLRNDASLRALISHSHLNFSGTKT